MRIETILKEVYNFDDVMSDENLKNKVLENYRDFNTSEDFWHNFIIDEQKEKLSNIGFNDVEIYYSGFWSQGDGACFICNNFDVKKILEHDMFKNFTSKQKNILSGLHGNGYMDLKIYHNFRYYHERSCSYDFSFDGDYSKDYNHISNLCNDFFSTLKSLHVNLSCDIYKMLESEYNQLQSDELILESLQCNEYEFDENGKIV